MSEFEDFCASNCFAPTAGRMHIWQAAYQAGLAARAAVDMVLYCPKCHHQHIDAPDERTVGWTNPPHKSHLCHHCKHVWRPSDTPTNGVANTASLKDSDTAPARVPDGWKLMPKNADQTMIDAWRQDQAQGRSLQSSYCALVAAAPEAP